MLNPESSPQNPPVQTPEIAVSETRYVVAALNDAAQSIVRSLTSGGIRLDRPTARFVFALNAYTELYPYADANQGGHARRPTAQELQAEANGMIDIAWGDLYPERTQSPQEWFKHDQYARLQREVCIHTHDKRTHHERQENPRPTDVEWLHYFDDGLLEFQPPAPKP